MVKCLECGAGIEVPRAAEIADVLECHTCGTRFVVFDVEPIEIDYLDEGEDWDEDWDEDSEDDLDSD
jgi:hypothetical protein